MNHGPVHAEQTMLGFVVKFVVTSIIVTAMVHTLMPRYRKWRHALLTQAICTLLLTLELTPLLMFDVRLSWIAAAALIAFNLWASVALTRRIVGKSAERGEGSSVSKASD